VAKSWERRTGEGAVAFSGFQTYIYMGPERTIAAVAAQVGVKESTVRQWSAKFDWVERSKDWDGFLAEIQQKKAQKILEEDAVKWARRRVDLREQEFTLAEKLMERANDILKMPLTQEIIKGTKKVMVEVDGEEHEVEVDTVTIIQPVKVTFRDAATMAEIASKMLRLSAEMETSRSKVDVTVTSDAERLEKAKKALEVIRDQMFAALRSERPHLTPQEIMQELVEWVADDWHVQPELLLETNQRSASAESDVDADTREGGEDGPVTVDGTIVTSGEDYDNLEDGTVQ